MKSAKILTQFTAILGILALPVFAFAQGLSFPHHFFGSVDFTNGAAPNGLTVEARINESVVGSSVTSGGNYGYGDQNQLFALDNEGVNAGKTVEFYVDGIKANETEIFVNGNSSQLNLTVPASIPTTPTPTPSGGGGTTTPPPTYKTGDANKDGKVDKYDFALLMANWGKTGANTSDLNGDGKVDKYDFAILMANWTVV